MTGPYRAAPRPSRELAPSLGWTRPVTWLLTLGGALVPALVGYSLSVPGGCSAMPEPPHVEGMPLGILFSGAPLWLGVYLQKRTMETVARSRVGSRLEGLLLGIVTLLPVGVFATFAVLVAMVILVHFEGLVPC